MIKILASHPKISDNELTHLSSAYTSGTSLTVRDSSTFAVNDYIVVGTLGDEKTEISLISAIPSATSLTISALSNIHPVDTPIQVIDYNQVEFSYSVANVTFTVLATSAINADQDATIYNHTAGLSSYYYKYRFYNSTTAAYSGYSDTITGAGYGSTSLYGMRELVREITNQKDDKFVSDDYIDSMLNAAQTEVVNYYPKWRFLEESFTTTATTVGINYISLPSDYDHTMTLIYNYVTTTDNLEYPLTEISFLEMMAKREDHNAKDSDYIYYFAIDHDTSRILFDQNSENSTNYFKGRYFKKIPALDDNSDTTIVPTPMVLVEYAVAYVRATLFDRHTAPVDLKAFREKLREMLKHERRIVSQPRGLRQPEDGLSLYFKGLR